MNSSACRVLGFCALFLITLGAAVAPGSEVISISIGAEWAPNGIVPWLEGVTHASVVMRNVPPRANVTSGHFLIGQFAGATWIPRDVTAISWTPGPDLGIATFEITFDEVRGQSVLLAVVAGPTTGLPAPVFFEFGHLTGDVTGDGWVTAGDSLIVLNHINSMADYDPRYDLNRDGSVSPSDAAIILNVINGPPDQTSMVRTDRYPPPSSVPETLEIRVEIPRTRAILTLRNLRFGFEYPIKTSLDLLSWSTALPVVASTTYGTQPAERAYPMNLTGRGFFRVAWPTPQK